MGIASEIRRLTQDIASSHDDRTKRVGEIRGQVRDLIKGFQASRKELRTELKEASAAWQGLTAAKAKNRKQRKED
jgi:hypothetical protein